MTRGASALEAINDAPCIARALAWTFVRAEASGSLVLIAREIELNDELARRIGVRGVGALANRRVGYQSIWAEAFAPTWSAEQVK